MPLRTVFMNATFVLPAQEGALVGIRAMALKYYKGCDNRIDRYDVPEVFHEPSALSSAGTEVLGEFIFFAGVFGTRLPNGTEYADPALNYYNALQNIQYIAAERGGNLADLVYLQTWYESPLVLYNALVAAIGRMYNATNFKPPGVTFDGSGVNPGGIRTSCPACSTGSRTTSR